MGPLVGIIMSVLHCLSGPLVGIIITVLHCLSFYPFFFFFLALLERSTINIRDEI